MCGCVWVTGCSWNRESSVGIAPGIGPNHHNNGSSAIAKQIAAVAYLQVSTPGQVEGDGFPRQREAITAYATKAGMKLVGEFRDEVVSGTLPLAERPGLSELFERILANGVRVLLIEKADRLARDLIESELALRELRKAGVRVIEVEGGHDLTAGDDGNSHRQARAPSARLRRGIREVGACREAPGSARPQAARDRPVRASGAVRSTTGRSGRAAAGARAREEAPWEAA